MHANSISFSFASNYIFFFRRTSGKSIAGYVLIEKSFTKKMKRQNKTSGRNYIEYYEYRQDAPHPHAGSRTPGFQ
jgi:hypothetical protein